MGITLTTEQKKCFIDLFKCPVYPIYDWEKILKKLKRKDKDEVIKIIDKTLRMSYLGRTTYPYQGCDFATDFGYMIFKGLGYNAKILQNFNNGEHNFLLVDGEGIDFTSKQFNENLPIRNIDFNLKYYKNSHEHTLRSNIFDKEGYKRFYREVKLQTLTGLMNYVPFSYIIENTIYKKKG